jgi:hypothetical protein
MERGLGDQMKVMRDDWCSNCQDWEQFDTEGKCKKCGKFIRVDRLVIDVGIDYESRFAGGHFGVINSGTDLRSGRSRVDQYQDQDDW